MNIAQSKQSAQRRLATVKSELTNTHRYYVKLLEKQRYLERVREDLRAEEKALEQFLFPPERIIRSKPAKARSTARSEAEELISTLLDLGYTLENIMDSIK